MTLELQEIYEDGDRALLYVTQPSWTFGLDDGDQQQFGVLFEIIDMYDATGEEEFENYPFVVEASIVAHEPSQEFAEDAGVDLSPDDYGYNLALIEMAYQYGGGVPITHIIQDEISKGSDKGLQPLLKGIPKRDYDIVEVTPQFGTVAAQRGPGTRQETVHFADYDAARKYVENMLSRLDALGVMIGFILDRPINMMGEPGWSTMEMHVFGPGRRRNNPSTSTKTQSKKLKSRLLR